MQEYLRPTQIARQIGRLLGRTVSVDLIDRLINDGSVSPAAIAGATPLFTREQLVEVGAALTGVDIATFRHQVRPVREAATALRIPPGRLREAVDAGEVPALSIPGGTLVHTVTVRERLAHGVPHA